MWYLLNHTYAYIHHKTLETNKQIYTLMTIIYGLDNLVYWIKYKILNKQLNLLLPIFIGFL